MSLSVNMFSIETGKSLVIGQQYYFIFIDSSQSIFHLVLQPRIFLAHFFLGHRRLDFPFLVSACIFLCASIIQKCSAVVTSRGMSRFPAFLNECFGVLWYSNNTRAVTLNSLSKFNPFAPKPAGTGC